MAVLYVDRKNSELRSKLGCLESWVDGARESSIPWKLLERVVVRSSVLVSTRVLLEACQCGVVVQVLDHRDWEASAIVYGPESADALRRVKQVQCLLNAEWRLRFCRRLLDLKLKGQLLLLEQIGSERVEARHLARKAQDTIREVSQELRRGMGATLQQLGGMEGGAARLYFSAYQEVFADSWRFRQRNRRPPKDPINALLSLGYTIEFGRCVQALRRSGLDASIGYLHSAAHGRQSLACDLLETMRTRVDRLVWQLTRTKRLRPEHFYWEGEKCLLGKAGRLCFYSAMEENRERDEADLGRLAGLLAKAIEDNAPLAVEDWHEQDAVL
jgi:CRISPR-associated protein Cas1